MFYFIRGATILGIGEYGDCPSAALNELAGKAMTIEVRHIYKGYYKLVHRHSGGGNTQNIWRRWTERDRDLGYRSRKTYI